MTNINSLISGADIEGLHENGSHSKIHKHRNLYEILKGKECDIPEDGEGYQMLYSNKLNALISYHHFKTKYKTVLFGDNSDFFGPNTFCVVVDVQKINGNAWIDWSEK
tara:strand:+ start:423 stop:746 length:324 start_codon:yes stop_codon:yes gene_type:complete